MKVLSCCSYLFLLLFAILSLHALSFLVIFITIRITFGCRYLHSDVPQYEDPSSEHRLARVRELPPPTDARDITTILGDTEDKKYPIYRTATPPDTAVTLATGRFIITTALQQELMCTVLIAL